MPAVQIGRQAVVIIHGIGEQRPMSTLRSFSSAILRTEGAKDEAAWSKPDKVSEGFEHRRFTLPGSRLRPVTDVYELYWAHLFEQSNGSTFWAWLTRIAFRPLPKLPARFRMPALLAWLAVVALCVALYGLWASIAGTETWKQIAGLPVLAAIYGLLLYQWNRFFLGTISDAARYLDASPRNVEARNKVRTLGVEFLERLHKSDRQYDRIVLCGHSLGSVIGYDILRHLWYRYHENHGQNEIVDQSVLKLVDGVLRSGKPQDVVPDLQRRLWAEQRLNGNKWRITDFVTLGSPLTHADMLLADSEAEFRTFVDTGELATCPPALDRKSKSIEFVRNYEATGGLKRSVRLLTHNAPFAVTRWSNIHFKRWMAILGDPIGGPLRPLFGAGISDYEVQAKGVSQIFCHTLYWDGPYSENAPRSSPLVALKAALDLEKKEISTDETP